MRAFIVALAVWFLGTNGAPQQKTTVQPPSTDLVEPYYENYTAPVVILSQMDTLGTDGSFNYSFDAANGIRQDASGFIKKVYYPVFFPNGTATGDQREVDVLVQVGSYSYYDPNGELVTISYIADENGFHASGDSIPTPPPIPEDILVSLRETAKSQNYTNEYLNNNGFTDTFESFTVNATEGTTPTTTTTTAAVTTTPVPSTTAAPSTTLTTSASLAASSSLAPSTTSA